MKNDRGRLHSAPATTTHHRSEGSTESGDCITLDEAIAELAGYLDRQASLLDLAVSPGLAHHLEAAACEVRRVRYVAEPDSSLGYLADRLAGHLEALWLLVAASASDYVRAGFEVSEAIELVDRHAEKLHSRMGGRP